MGNGDLTVNEQRAHFALWALLKSPMLIGADLRTLSPASLAILKAREVLEVHQDDLGVAGDLVWKQARLWEGVCVSAWDSLRCLLCLQPPAACCQHMEL